jgi:hypothetical protein
MIIGAQERGTPAAVAAERHDVHTTRNYLGRESGFFTINFIFL